jgi:arylsulfatase A-like enzyme
LLAALRDLYEGEVAYLDAILGKLIDDLRGKGLTDDTIIVLTSDHGESLGEHDLVFHQFSVHEILLRVPLILHYPKRVSPGRVSTPVSLADVYPTLVRLAALNVPENPGLAGRDLLTLPTASQATDRRILAEYTAPLEALPKYRLGRGTVDESYFKRDLKSIRGGGLKLVWASDGRNELYDLAEDPWETRNLISERADSAQSLKDALSRELISLKPVTGASHEGSTLDEDTRRELRALGYVQ